MFKFCTNSKKQGDVGLGVAIGWFSSNGHTVCIPLTDSQDYDLIVDNSGSLFKVQVKTTKYKENGIFIVALKTCGGNRSRIFSKLFDNTKVDLLFVLTETGQKYLIPSLEIEASSAIRLGEKYASFLVT